MGPKTFGDFLEDEINKRKMSYRKFAAFIGVDPGTISKFVHHGKSDFYSGRPIGDPDLDFLKRLSDKTGVDICALVSLVCQTEYAGIADAGTIIIAQQFEHLPENKREIINLIIRDSVPINKTN